MPHRLAQQRMTLSYIE